MNNSGDSAKLKAAIGKLMADHNNPSIENHTSPCLSVEPVAWQKLGELIGNDINMMTHSPKLSGMELYMLRLAMRDHDFDAVAIHDRRYAASCQEFEKRFSTEKLWQFVDSYFDRPEYRQELVDVGKEPTISNLIQLADQRAYKKKYGENA